MVLVGVGAGVCGGVGAGLGDSVGVGVACGVGAGDGEGFGVDIGASVLQLGEVNKTPQAVSAYIVFVKELVESTEDERRHTMYWLKAVL